MKTYQSITSLATSPAISSNSLYSNGFFVTLTPPPPTQSSNNNNKSSPVSTTIIPSTTATTEIKTNNSIMTPISCPEETTNQTSFKTNQINSIDVNDGVDDHDDEQHHLHNNQQIVNTIDEHQLNNLNDIEILLNNYDKKMLHINNQCDDNNDDDDELSVENTRL